LPMFWAVSGQAVADTPVELRMSPGVGRHAPTRAVRVP